MRGLRESRSGELPIALLVVAVLVVVGFALSLYIGNIPVQIEFEVPAVLVYVVLLIALTAGLLKLGVLEV